MFFQGSENYPTVKQLERDIYRCGGNFNAFTDLDETVFHIECSSDCMDQACDIISDALYRSLFSPQKLVTEKKVVVNELKEYESDPPRIAYESLQEILFKGTRLEKRVGGTVKTVQGVTVNVLKNFVNTYYTGNDAITVSIVSSKPLSEGVRVLKKHFKDVPHYDVPKILSICNDRTRILYPDCVFSKKTGKIRYTHNPSPQSYLSIGFPSPRYSLKATKDRFTMNIISELLSGYMSAYLYDELRHKKGLIYHISSGSMTQEDLGFFMIETATQNRKETVEQTCSLLLDVCSSLPTLITEDTLQDAKDHLLQGMKLSDKDVHSIGLMNATNLVHLGKILTDNDRQRHLKSVTVSDVQSLATKVFRYQTCHISYTGSKKYL